MAKFSLPHLSRKSLLLLGILTVLVIAIPLTVFLVQQQQEVRSRAEIATVLSLTPSSADKKVGDPVSFDIMVNPGVNQVNFINLVITYDSTKLEADKDNPNLFEINPTSHLTVLSGPNVDSNTISITLSEEDPTQPITQITKAGTINLVASAPTEATGTRLSFDETQTIVRSLGGTDPSNVSVLSSSQGATVQISGEVSPTPTPTTTPTATATPTTIPTTSPSPTNSPSASPSTSPTAGASPATGSAPICSGLTLEGESQGDAPFAVTLTTTGDDSDGTITKVTFNFGDGNIEDITDSGGVGSESINAQVTHTYDEPGTFTAQATLTDNDNNTSSESDCSQQIIVTGPSISPTPSPTPIPPTGPSATVVAAGVLGIALTVLGAFLFLVL